MATVYDTAGGGFCKLLPEITPGLPAMTRGYFDLRANLRVASFTLLDTRDGAVLSAIPAQAPSNR